MNNRNIIIAVVVVLVLAGGIWYMSSSTETSDTSSTDVTTPADTASDQTVSSSQNGSLGSLMKRGGNYTCTISTIGDTGKTTGTIFASNGKTRLDFEVEEIEGMVTTMHTIRDGSWSYTWIDGQTMGFKTAIKTSGAVSPQPTGGVIGVNEDEQVASDCHPWNPVMSMFTPPAGITF